jgi:coproporphyrinogen III oxidase
MKLKERASRYFTDLQARICGRLEALEGKAGARFSEDRWRHDSDPDGSSGGGGVTRVLSEGKLFEKAGVNFSGVTGELTATLADRLEVPAQPFFATGVSLVIHPLSPMVPTTHMNLRYIELLGSTEGGKRAWFGGGADLTPYYLFEEDAQHFHGVWRDVCDRHEAGDYPRFKKWCDDYFHNKHRGEARGVGGIFFDYLEDDPERTFEFVQDSGGSFLEAFEPIVERRRGDPWYDREREWQLIRRGRYVEFNLVHDRGTLFGLETRGRTESILISLPPLVRWVYDHHPDPGTPEEALVEVLRTPRDWV